MSKMSQLAMELDEQASELGFESYIEALNNGFEVEDDKLVKSEPKTAKNALKMRNTGNSNEDLEYELASLEWEREKIDKEIAKIKEQLK